MKKMMSFNQFIKESNKSFQYNEFIDYTLLDNNASDDDIKELCEKAKQFNTKTVCVMPKHVKVAKECLKNSSVGVCTVVSFPNGDNSTSEKVNETKQVIRDGADEVDMVYNYKLLKEESKKNPIDVPSEWERTEEINSLIEDMEAVKDVIPNNVILKVIVESGELNEKETEVATLHCLEAGVDFIKTSTGKTSVGAEPNKVKIMRQTIIDHDSKMEIKASGGVRTLDQIEEYSTLGVTRFGMGFGAVDKLNGLDSKNEGY
jgi:deoxyribose-phosphate aldolase